MATYITLTATIHIYMFIYIHIYISSPFNSKLLQMCVAKCCTDVLLCVCPYDFCILHQSSPILLYQTHQGPDPDAVLSRPMTIPSKLLRLIKCYRSISTVSISSLYGTGLAAQETLRRCVIWSHVTPHSQCAQLRYCRHSCHHFLSNYKKKEGSQEKALKQCMLGILP